MMAFDLDTVWFSKDKDNYGSEISQITAVDLIDPIVAVANVDDDYLAVSVNDNGKIAGIDSYGGNPK